MGAEQSGTTRKLFDRQRKNRTEGRVRNYSEPILMGHGILSSQKYDGRVLSHSLHENRTSNTSDSDNEVSSRHNDPVRDNLVMLPSTLDPLGRKIRRISTDIVDGEEQLLLVKRRASAARRFALNSSGSDQHNNPSQSTNPLMLPRDFEYLKDIGVGGMGHVVLVRNRRNGRLYAMKVVSKRSVRDKNQIKHVISERDVLGGTHHHSLVHLHWAFQTKRSLYLVMDYCPGGELSVHLQAAERFPEPVATFYAAELVLALEHLHRHGIVYRDLKPENILLTAEGHLKLVDFGLSKFGITEATKGATSICGSYEYVAPEVFENNGYGTAIDWWSFGVVLYEMLTGLPPWYHETPHVMQRYIRTKPLTFPSYISTTARSLLRQLLALDPTQRLGSCEGSLEVRRHRFFQSVDWQMHTFREIDPPIRPYASDDSIDNAMNVDLDTESRLSMDSMDSPSTSSEEFGGFDFEAPTHSHIQYGYKRDLGAIVA